MSVHRYLVLAIFLVNAASSSAMEELFGNPGELSAASKQETWSVRPLRDLALLAVAHTIAHKCLANEDFFDHYMVNWRSTTRRGPVDVDEDIRKLALFLVGSNNNSYAAYVNAHRVSSLPHAQWLISILSPAHPCHAAALERDIVVNMSDKRIFGELEVAQGITELIREVEKRFAWWVAFEEEIYSRFRPVLEIAKNQAASYNMGSAAEIFNFDLYKRRYQKLTSFVKISSRRLVSRFFNALLESSRNPENEALYTALESYYLLGWRDYCQVRKVDRMSCLLEKVSLDCLPERTIKYIYMVMSPDQFSQILNRDDLKKKTIWLLEQLIRRVSDKLFQAYLGSLQRRGWKFCNVTQLMPSLSEQCFIRLRSAPGQLSARVSNSYWGCILSPFAMDTVFEQAINMPGASSGAYYALEELGTLYCVLVRSRHERVSRLLNLAMRELSTAIKYKRCRFFGAWEEEITQWRAFELVKKINFSKSYVRYLATTYCFALLKNFLEHDKNLIATFDEETINLLKSKLKDGFCYVQEVQNESSKKLEEILKAINQIIPVLNETSDSMVPHQSRRRSKKSFNFFGLFS